MRELKVLYNSLVGMVLGLGDIGNSCVPKMHFRGIHCTCST